MGRFVIHRHSGYGPTHYDLMLERGEVLVTWQFDTDPTLLAVGMELECRQIQDHRMIYLTYEGPVSKDRGRVERVERGQYVTTREDTDGIGLELAGEIIRGRFELVCTDEPNARWLLRAM